MPKRTDEVTSFASNWPMRDITPGPKLVPQRALIENRVQKGGIEQDMNLLTGRVKLKHLCVKLEDTVRPHKAPKTTTVRPSMGPICLTAPEKSLCLASHLALRGRPCKRRQIRDGLERRMRSSGRSGVAPDA